MTDTATLPRATAEVARPPQSARAAARAPAGPRNRGRPAPGWVFGGALGAFFAALALLAFQVRAGQDPALGSGANEVAATSPRPVVIRRVVVHHRSGGAAPAAASAPEPAAPAPEAPAPLTTQSS